MNEQQPLSLERLAEIRSRSEHLAMVCQATGTPRTMDEYERDCLLAEVDRLRAAQTKDREIASNSLGTVIDDLGGLIENAWRKAATDPWAAIHMLGNYLAEANILELDEHNAIYEAIEQQRSAPRLIAAAEIQLGDVVADSVGGTWTQWTAVTTADGLRLATGHQVLPAEYVEENYGPLILIERRGSAQLLNGGES